VIGEGSILADSMFSLYMLTYQLEDCSTPPLQYTQRSAATSVQRLQAGTISFASYLGTSLVTGMSIWLLLHVISLKWCGER
jgi:hypothetical protein